MEQYSKKSRKFLNRLLPEGIRRDRTCWNAEIPKHLSARFRELDDDALSRVRESLLEHYFKKHTAIKIEKNSELRKDLEDHLLGRLITFRKTVIPWLDNAKSLDGARILEIGCGTGASTVTLAEQGAYVTAVDISEPALTVAKKRCAEYDVKVQFVSVNATDIQAQCSDRCFDMIIFFASLEHMTYDERIAAMKTTWDMLPEGSLWCAVDTPNRLWYSDLHTSHLPFFMWLPDDLALDYSRFSPRDSIREIDREKNDNAMLSFLRRGRGVSFHEFEIAIMQVDCLDIVSCLTEFPYEQKPTRHPYEHPYEKFLRDTCPRVPTCFYHPSLDLIIRKHCPS
ncbi:MAG: methyltransferase domain-containing protein [Candidatus Bathyarchaeia archaeon]|jgi:S-adenosylmethionine-dependent methyltransferase